MRNVRWPEIHDPVITISLLDPMAGYAVRSWEFDGYRWSLRALRNEHVVLNDTTVSRMHAATRTDAGWSVTALGRNGIVVRRPPITGATPIVTKRCCVSRRRPYLEFRLDADETPLPRGSTKNGDGRTPGG